LKVGEQLAVQQVAIGTRRATARWAILDFGYWNIGTLPSGIGFRNPISFELVVKVFYNHFNSFLKKLKNL
jgi:hypothetical protein